MKRLVDYNPQSGITTSMDYDPVTDMTTIISEFDDLEPALRITKHLQNDPEYTRKGIKECFWHYSFIPNHLIHKWMVEEGINVYRKEDEARVWKKINSPEYRYLKTTTKNHVPRQT